MALTLITLCSVLISCYVSTPPAGGVCCSNHPQLCASVSRFWTFAILWKLPPLFLSCANTVQWLISFWILGAHLFQTVHWQPNHVEKNTKEMEPSPSFPLQLEPKCNSQLKGMLFLLASRRKQFTPLGSYCILWLGPSATPLQVLISY